MKTLKQKNMFASYTGFKGEQTVKAILAQIPDDLKKRLTGTELGLVMDAVDNAYHNGKKTGLEIIDGECIFYAEKLIPLKAIAAIEVVESAETTLKDAAHRMAMTSFYDENGKAVDTSAARMAKGVGYFYKDHKNIKSYTLNYTEIF